MLITDIYTTHRMGYHTTTAILGGRHREGRYPRFRVEGLSFFAITLERFFGWHRDRAKAVQNVLGVPPTL